MPEDFDRYLRVPSEHIPYAILSFIIKIMAKVDVLEMRIDDIAKGNSPASNETYDKLLVEFQEEYTVRFLSKYGQ